MNSIENNFDLSVVLPFYKKIKEFKKVLPKNSKFLQRNGIEVIIALDGPTEEKELLELISLYPFINWKVIVNKKYHRWRNPSKAINVGIRNATKQYLMVMSPESEFFSDVILQLRMALTHNENCCVVGTVTFCELDEPISNIKERNFLPYGSIMAKTQYFRQVRGYNEEFNKWGGDDDNLRIRLNILGIATYLDESAILIHREEKTKKDKRYLKQQTQRYRGNDFFKDIYYPTSHITNGENWGCDFNDIVYDWKKKSNGYDLCKQYLSSFSKYYIKPSPEIFLKEHKLVALTRSYNNVSNINEFLHHLDRYCDGVVLLDDDSKDGTYELADCEKLLIKVQKKRKEFNDSELFNILLNIGSFINTSWFYFIDSDERFDERFSDFSFLLDSKGIDNVLFKLVHIWDSEKYYRVDYPFSNHGVQEKWRMFKNIGRMQIITSKKLHFPPIPYVNKVFRSNILLLHYGNMDKKKRIEKYNFYMQEDKFGDQKSYSHFLSEQVKVEKVKNIYLETK